MQQNVDIQTLWNETMVGRERDTIKFVDHLLVCLIESKEIAAEVRDEGISLSIGSNEVIVIDKEPVTNMRFMCARLANIFRSSSVDPGNIYGGEVSSLIDVAGKQTSAKLQFSNTTKAAWFRMSTQ